MKSNSTIPLGELGPDHESWVMKDAGGCRLSIFDKARQHKGYAEAGSFGDYLLQTYGINKVKQFNRLSHEKDRPWREVIGIGLQELEANWLETLKASERARERNVLTVMKLFETNPGTACAEAQKLTNRKR